MPKEGSLQGRRTKTIPSSERAGCVEDAGNGSCESSRDGEREEPGKDDVAEQAPVHPLAGPHPTDEHDRAHFAVGGADWDAYLGSQQNRGSSTNLDGEATTTVEQQRLPQNHHFKSLALMKQNAFAVCNKHCK